jgi:hypothetical protein
VEGFFFWDFMKSAVRWRDEFSSHVLSPVYEQVHRLIHGEWATRERLRSDANGLVRFRGFLGEYAARVRCGEVRRGTRFEVLRGHAMPLTVVYPFAPRPRNP